VNQELVPLALGVAISPVPILAVITMVLATRARASSVGFVLGWVAGIALACSLCVLLSRAIEEHRSVWSKAESLALLVLGILFLLLALSTFRRRPRDAEVPDLPRWLASVDRLNVGRAAGLGLLLVVVNPKNLVIFPAAGSAIATQQSSPAEQATAVLVFTCIAASTVALPVWAYAVAQPRVAVPLEGIRAWLIRHTALVIVALAFLIAAVLLTRGLAGLL
jgi:threonine/homoserine/homoserine lactone efflux protein